MLRPVSTERLKITRKLARQHSEETPVKGDRRHRPSLSAELLDEILNGKFLRDPTWVVCFCKETRSWWRGDGKHTSCIFDDVANPITQPDGSPIFCSYQRWEADTKDDVVDLYLMFNPGLSGKTKGDYNRARAGLMDEFDGMKDRIINLCVDGLLFADMGISYMSIRNKKRQDWLKGTNEFCAFAIKILSPGSQVPFLMKAGVVAAMKWSFDDNPELALEFWLGVRDGTNTDPKSIERRMRDYLIGQIGSNKNVQKTMALKRCRNFWKSWYKTRRATEAKLLDRAKARRGTRVRTQTAAKKGIK